MWADDLHLRTMNDHETQAPRPKGPGRRKLTRELYEALVQGYRSAPGVAAHAARIAGCDSRLASKAWAEGWRGYPWARPIRDVLAAEAHDARALAARAMREAEDAARARAEDARAESVEAQAQERAILRAARSDVLAVLVLAAELVPSMRVLVRVVSEAMRPGEDGSLPSITPSAALGMLTRHASLVSKGLGAAETILALSRLDRGEATARVEVGIGALPEDMPLADALAELAASEATLREARARGLLDG